MRETIRGFDESCQAGVAGRRADGTAPAARRGPRRPRRPASFLRGVHRATVAPTEGGDIPQPAERFRVARTPLRLPVRTLIGAVASTPIAVLAATLVLLVGSPDAPHWVTATLVAGGLAASYAVAVAATRHVTRRVAELERQRDAFFQEFTRLSKAASLGEIASGIAHDLNNPLAIMNEEAGWSEDLLAGPDLAQEGTRQELANSVAQIRLQIKRAGGVTQRLLHWARDMDRPTGATDSNRTLTRTLYLLESELAAANVQVVRRFDPELPLAAGDEAEISQVFLHLIKNALDAMKGTPGTLTLTTAHDDRLVRVTVADSGPGIREDRLGRIFEPFFTTKAAGEGTGLGLSISAWIVQRSGGQIAVASPPGGGATFTVTLPEADQPAPRGGTHEDHQAAARR